MAKKELTVEVIAEKITATPTGLATGNTASVAAGVTILIVLGSAGYWRHTTHEGLFVPPIACNN